MVIDPRPGGAPEAAGPVVDCRASSRLGPLTMSIGKTLEVVVVRAKALNSGHEDGLERGEHERERLGLDSPAMVALMAASSTVATP